MSSFSKSVRYETSLYHQLCVDLEENCMLWSLLCLIRTTAVPTQLCLHLVSDVGGGLQCHSS